MAKELSPILAVLAAGGFLWPVLAGAWANHEHNGTELWGILASLAIATFIVHAVVPAGLDVRYMLPALAALTVFA